MYAVIRTGGKQYRVAKDDVLTVERIEGDAGDAIDLMDVIAIGDDKGLKTGNPIEGAAVRADIVKQDRGEKIIIFKKKRRKTHQRTRGHRQDLTVIRVTDIVASGAKPAAKKAEKKAEAPKAEAKAEGDKAESKPAAKKTAAKKTATKKTATKKAASKSATKKTAAKKTTAKKSTTKKTEE